jgi:nicotinamide-nucleotide amidase
MNIEIIAIGTELLLGQSVDTNSSWLAKEMARMGIDVYSFQAVGDNEKRIETALKGACERSQAVLTTGGLGPTVDDVTRKVAAKLASRTLVYHENIAKEIEARFARNKLPFAKVNLNQAFIPQGAVIIPNPVGTAPGFIVKVGKSHLACMPGVPAEMKSMFEATVKPFLKELSPTESLIKSRVYRTTGISESQLNEMIRDLFEKSTNPTVGVLAHKEGVDIRLTAKAASDQEADTLLDGLGKTLTQLLPNYIYGLDQEDLETIVGRMMTTRGLSLALAEFCTGGLIAHRITRVPGSSRYFKAGYVSYSNEAKTDLFGVEPALIKSKGAVSPEVALKMAEGALKRSGASIALSATGIAGPDGGTPEKPVGLVWMGLCDESGSQAVEYRFFGHRDNIQFRASQAALELLRRHVLGMALKG